jgi:hypothetical protein
VSDQAKDWLYALPEDQADSFHRLQEAFMTRYTPNPLQRYQQASHVWSRMQQDNESVDSYFTSIISAANQIKLRDEQQLCFCLIRGLKPHLRLHVLQNNHGTVGDIQHSARVAEIASADVDDNGKAVAEPNKVEPHGLFYIGTNFTSSLTQLLLQRLGCAPRFNSSYHPHSSVFWSG